MELQPNMNIEELKLITEVIGIYLFHNRGLLSANEDINLENLKYDLELVTKVNDQLRGC